MLHKLQQWVWYETSLKSLHVFDTGVIGSVNSLGTLPMIQKATRMIEKHHSFRQPFLWECSAQIGRVNRSERRLIIITHWVGDASVQTENPTVLNQKQPTITADPMPELHPIEYIPSLYLLFPPRLKPNSWINPRIGDMMTRTTEPETWTKCYRKQWNWLESTSFRKSTYFRAWPVTTVPGLYPAPDTKVAFINLIK